MKISELISELEAQKKVHGDLRVMKNGVFGIEEVMATRIEQIREKRPREQKTRYVQKWASEIQVPIESVIHI